MNEEYNVTPTSKHYTCMIDLLGRAGRLDEGALLGASRVYGNTELGEEAAEMVFKMGPQNSGISMMRDVGVEIWCPGDFGAKMRNVVFCNVMIRSY
ncbi:PPR domain protein [Medicago truncatula]|uniref:PPR domain protein n=1 Tax=Medicago truncatula TaxID=3880 RepID=G7KNV5_MEDTR|nr:PPR domain protein [Medicago truncatula]